MLKENNQHLQPYLISNINDLPEKQKSLLEKSWSGTFYKEAPNFLEFQVLFLQASRSGISEHRTIKTGQPSRRQRRIASLRHFTTST